MPREPASAEQLTWEATCPRAITSDALWTLDAYRSALFLLHVAGADPRQSLAGKTSEAIISQLVEAVGSISANISEGYSRATRADRLRFLGYALGSDRECITWYLAAREALEPQTLDARLELIARTRALLLGLIRSLRPQRPDSSFEP